MTVMVDAERLVSAWLRTQGAVTTLVGQRVYTTVPSQATFPLIRVQQIGGAPVFQPLWLDESYLQFDFYGGPKAQARALLDTTRSLLEDLPGAHDLGVVTAVEFGQARYLPDDTFSPPQPRWIADVSIYSHP